MPVYHVGPKTGGEDTRIPRASDTYKTRRGSWVGFASASHPNSESRTNRNVNTMGLGVLEDKHLAHVPGTALLTDVLEADHEHHHHGRLNTSALRHGQGKDSDIVLVPQPSRSPNDPLNWPLWKKDLMLFFICIDTAVVGAWGPMISPGYVEMAAQFGVSYNKLNGDLGYGILVIGLSCFVTNSMAVIWGRRPVFLLGNLLLFISSLGAYYAHSFNSLLAFRLVGCFGMSPFEVLVTSTIADIYFVHQRGVRLAAWGLCLSIGVGGGTIISGYIIEGLGWNWTYGICAIIFGVWIVVLFLFCPETAYRRDDALNTDLGTEQDNAEAIAKNRELKAKYEGEGAEIENVEIAERAAANNTSCSMEKKRTFWHDLKIYNGRVCDDPFWKVLIRPLMMLIFPQVLFSLFAYGLTTSWLVVVGGVLAQIFAAPPYNFSVSSVGLVAVASLIGAIIGAFTSGPIADWTVKFMSRRNGGIYEPEFRLVLIVITFLLGGMSFFGFGWALQEQDPWIAPVIFYGLQYFSVGFMTIAVYGYLTDCHRDKAPEAFAAINLRNIYSFGMNYFISDWITTQGPKQVFCIIGGIHVFICLCAIPMYIYGKKCRSWTSRVSIFEKVMHA
ncbi:MFS general substrate transporter [Whalleya microplaca]|nr:MFS general substrate transporter [Whalleya microplaca]